MMRFERLVLKAVFFVPAHSSRLGLRVPFW